MPPKGKKPVPRNPPKKRVTKTQKIVKNVVEDDENSVNDEEASKSMVKGKKVTKRLPTQKVGVPKPKVPKGPKVVKSRTKKPKSGEVSSEEIDSVSEGDAVSDVEIAKDDKVMTVEELKGNEENDNSEMEEENSDVNFEDEEEDDSDEFSKIGQEEIKSFKKWPYELEKKLIVLWKEETHLYDTTCPDYRNSHLRAAAQRRFSAILKRDVNDIKVHMESLRSTYRKLLKIPSGSSGDRLTPRQQQITELCSFIRVHLQNRDSISNVPKKKKKKNKPSGGKMEGTPKGDDDPSTSGVKPDDDGKNAEGKGKQTPGLPLKKTSKRKQSEPNGENSQQVNVISDSDDNQPAYYVTSKRKKYLDSKKKEELSSAIRGRNDILENLTNSLSTLAQSKVVPTDETKSNENDSFDLWSKLLSEKLRKMEPKTAERFKLFVDTAAYDAMEGNWTPK